MHGNLSGRQFFVIARIEVICDCRKVIFVCRHIDKCHIHVGHIILYTPHIEIFTGADAVNCSQKVLKPINMSVKKAKCGWHKQTVNSY